MFNGASQLTNGCSGRRYAPPLNRNVINDLGMTGLEHLRPFASVMALG